MKIGKYDVCLKKSNRKTIAIQITKDLKISVFAPFSITDDEIQRIVLSKSEWIDKHLSKKQEVLNLQYNLKKLTDEEIKLLSNKAAAYIPKRVKYYADKEGFSYNKIRIKTLVSRWGSCSSKRNLNFNCLIMLAPNYVIDYVVVHELCHLREMNHSKKFWAEVKKILPNYEMSTLWLKENGRNIIARIKP